MQKYVLRPLAFVHHLPPSFCPLPRQAAMLEEGVLDRAARGVWGTSSKPDRYSK